MVLLDIPVDQIRANPSQPREHFDPEALAELVHSLQTVGLLQPIVVRTAGQGYELIAGSAAGGRPSRQGGPRCRPCCGTPKTPTCCAMHCWRTCTGYN